MRMAKKTLTDGEAVEILKSLRDDIKMYAEIDVQILHRFKLEPRAQFQRSSNCWLVAWDKYRKTYVTEPGGRAYMRFRDSESALEFFRNNYTVVADGEYDIELKEKKGDE